MSNATETPALGRLGYSAREVAGLLGCSERHIKNLMRTGQIPSVLLGSGKRGRRIVLESALRNALAEREQRGWQSDQNKEAA